VYIAHKPHAIMNIIGWGLFLTDTASFVTNC